MKSIWIGLALLLTCVRCDFLHAAQLEIVRDTKHGTALIDLGEQGSGSGFCIDKSGLFVTNNHVVVAMGATGSIKVVINPTEPDQQVLEATVLARSSKYDLAVIRVQGAKDLVPLPLGDDSKLGETDPVTAFGYPFGKMLATGQTDFPGISVNTGKVTALRRAGGSLSRIQIDAAVNPGNSGGPVIDAGGKVIGVVVSGVRAFGGQTGVNFAIPVSKLRQFLSTPYARLIRPRLNWAMRYEPLDLKASLFEYGNSGSDAQLELVFDEPGQQSRTVPMVRQADGLYHANAAPMVKPADSTLIQISALCEGGLLHGWSADHSVQVGSQTIKLSQIQSMTMLPKPSVRTTDDRVLEGAVRDLGGMTVADPDRGANLPIDLAKSPLITVGDPGESLRTVHCRLIVRRGGKVVSQTSSEFAVSRSVGSDPPNAQVEDSAVAAEADARTLRFPYRIYSIAIGGNGQYLAMFLRSVRLVAVVDLYAGKAVAFLPCDDDDALVAAGQDTLLVADNHAREIRSYDLRTAQLQEHRTFDAATHFIRVAVGSASDGPVVLMGEHRSHFLSLRTLRDMPADTNGNVLDFDDVSMSPDGSTLTGWKLKFPPAAYRVRIRDGRAIGIITDQPFGQFYPNFDGSLLLGIGSVFTKDLRVRGQKNENYRFLPCAGAGLYIGLTGDMDEGGGVIGTVFNAVDGKPLCQLPALPELDPLLSGDSDEQPNGESGRLAAERIPFNTRVLVDAPHDLLATIPPSDDRVMIRRFSIAQTAAAHGSDAMNVQSTPRTHYVPGEAWSYAIDVRGRKPQRYALTCAPAGMQLSGDGKLSWVAPTSVSSAELLVSVDITDSQNRHLEHAFLLEPEIAPPEADQRKRTEGGTVSRKTRAEFAKLQRALKAKPGDVELSNRLVEMSLVEFDEKQTARQYSATAGPAMQHIASLAVQPYFSMSPADAKALGEYYLDAASRASESGKRLCEISAGRALNWNLFSARTNDTARSDTAARAVKLSARNSTDLFPLIHAKLSTVSGKWSWNGDLLRGDPGTHARMGIDFHPPESYRLHVEFTIPKGKNTETNIIVPVGSNAAAIVLNGWNGAAAITDIRGRSPPRVEAHPFALEIGRLYAVDVFVAVQGDEARIAVDVDGLPIVDWRGKQDLLHTSDTPWSLPDSTMIGLGANAAMIDFKTAWVAPMSDPAAGSKPNRDSTDSPSYLAEWQTSATEASVPVPATSPTTAPVSRASPETPALVMHLRPNATAMATYVTAGRFVRLEGAVRSADPAISFKIVCDGTPVWKSAPGADKTGQPFSINVAHVDKVDLVCTGGANAADATWLGARFLDRDDARLSPDTPLWASVADAVANHHASAIASASIGADAGDEFEDVPANGAILIGLRMTFHGNKANQSVSSVQGIYLRPDGGELLGAVHGKLAERLSEHRANAGYAVGSVTIKSPREMRSLELSYVRLNDTGIDPEDPQAAFFARMMGGDGGGDSKTLGSNGRPIIGFGGHFGDRLKSISIFTAP